MSTKAELIKDSLQRIRILELELEKDVNNEALKRILAHERMLLDEIKSAT